MGFSLLLFSSIRISESDDSSLNSEELEGSAASHHHFHHHHNHHQPVLKSMSGSSQCGSNHPPSASCGKSCGAFIKGTANEDSDTGLESMSSAGTPNKRSCSLCIDDETSRLQNDNFRQEINKLKCDKLDLLRQNVVSSPSEPFDIYD